MKKILENQRYCGNCDGHNPYQYPSKIFCQTRYIKNQNPIVDTLWCCAGWTQITQLCHCVEEALKDKQLQR